MAMARENLFASYRVKRLQAVFRHPDLLFACWRQEVQRVLTFMNCATASAGPGSPFIYLGI